MNEMKMHPRIRNAANELLKEMINECTEKQQEVFKRCYGHRTHGASLSDIIDKIHDDSIGSAVSLVERTIVENNKRNIAKEGEPNG